MSSSLPQLHGCRIELDAVASALGESHVVTRFRLTGSRIGADLQPCLPTLAAALGGNATLLDVRTTRRARRGYPMTL